jgi:tripartite-type tricarboxylate transporter receptor subunit TctC
MSVMRLAIRGLVLSALAVSATASAQSSNYPVKPVRFVAPFAPGGLVDVLSRALGEKLRASLGQPIVVDNRPGAGGNIGADLVARAEPDGYTLLMTSAGILTINQFLYKKMPFDPVQAFAPVSLVAEMHMLMVLHPGYPAQKLPDFLAAARKDPGKINFGSPGNGTTGHLGMEMLQAAAKIKLTHVAYRSAAEAALAVIGGQIQGAMDNPPTVLQHIRAGTLRAVAVASPRRLPQLPDVPTFDEAGLKGFEASSWFGVVAPARTPKEVVTRLTAEIGNALRDAELQSRFANLGARLAPNTPQEFDAFIRAERIKWEKIVRGADIALQ